VADKKPFLILVENRRPPGEGNGSLHEPRQAISGLPVATDEIIVA
jgi:hypothetical protein